MTKSNTNITRRRAIAVMALAAVGTRAQAAEAGRTLIICYSRTGNTLKLAEALQKHTGAALLVLEPVIPYAVSYGAMTDIAREEKRLGKRREIKTTVPDLSAYDTVYLGTPYWWGGLAVPMWTFLTDHLMAGKTIRPFITSGSSSPDGALAELRKLCPKAAVTACFHADSSTLSTAQADILAWAEGRLK